MSGTASKDEALNVEVVRGEPRALDKDVLAALVYGTADSPLDDPRFVPVGLATTDNVLAFEVWHTAGAVVTGESGPIRYATGGGYLFGHLEVDELRAGGVSAAAEAAYRSLLEFQARQAERHLLRIWNHLYAINDGEGDLERYRQFCLGRARGLDTLPPEMLPAGTAVGRRNRPGVLQICWLAGSRPGRPVGNPRQVQAYHYPRRYGPAAPSFSRAMLLSDDSLMGSGTASIVGHESRHDGDLHAQIDETLTNLLELFRAGDELSAREREDRGSIAAKVYLRDGSCASSVAARIEARLPSRTSLLLLEADICRRELLVEIECTRQ